MSSAVSLPPALRQRLAGVGRRGRLLRAVRGASLLVLALALTAAAAVLADYCLDGTLPYLVRLADLALWCLLGAFLFVTGLLVPLCRRLHPSDLAAAVEDRYPDLDERLVTSVELA